VIDPNKTTKLQQLSAQLPVASARLQQQQQAARDLQLQQAVQKAPEAVPVQATAAQIGQAQAASAGQQAIAAAQKQVESQAQVAEQAVAVERLDSQKGLAQAEMGVRQQQQDLETKLSNVSLDGKRELYDKTMEFKRDELGRTKFNEDQMDDYALSKARNEDEFRNYSQQVDLLYQRKQTLYDVQLKKVSQELQQQSQLKNQLLDQLQGTELTALQKRAARDALQKLGDNQIRLEKLYQDKALEYNKTLADKANRAAKKRAIIGTLLAIPAAVGGAYAGGPAGALAGFQAGQAAGSVLADNT
jgi:hypothetical protein